VKIHSSIAVFLKSLALALARILRSARSDERDTSRSIGSGQNQSEFENQTA
jgi:hypothetical protein